MILAPEIINETFDIVDFAESRISDLDKHL